VVSGLTAPSHVPGAANGTKWDRDFLVSALKTHHDAIEFAASLFKSNVRGISSTCVVATVAKAFYTQDKDRLREFAESLCTGIVANPAKDGAALRLRDWLMVTNTASGGDGIRNEHCAKIQSALRHYLNYKPLSRLVAVQEDRFPVPQVEI
jgi:hypothetical protein